MSIGIDFDDPDDYYDINIFSHWLEDLEQTVDIRTLKKKKKKDEHTN